MQMILYQKMVNHAFPGTINIWPAMSWLSCETEFSSSLKSPIKIKFISQSELPVIRITYPMNILCDLVSFTNVPKSKNCLKYISWSLQIFTVFLSIAQYRAVHWVLAEFLPSSVELKWSRRNAFWGPVS